MGASYGSFHVRGATLDGIRPLLDQVVAATGTKLFVGAPRGGWLTVYPSGGGQDARAASALAERTDHDVVHVLVHDDDIFAYHLFRGRRLVDEYSSVPDYFGDVSATERARLRGRPELFEGLLAEGATVDALRELLTRPHEPPGDETPEEAFRELMARGPDRAALDRIFPAPPRMRRFAALLGLTQVERSFEMLEEGSASSRRGLVRLPDERAAQRAEAAALRAETKRLRREGVLLARVEGKLGPYNMSPYPVICGHPDGGVLVAWSRYAGDEPARPVERWMGPQPQPTAVMASPSVHRVSVSASGRYVALGFAAGRWATEVVEAATGRVVREIPQKRASEGVAFDSGERFCFVRSEGELWAVDLQTGESTQWARYGKAFGLHPRRPAVVADLTEAHAAAVGIIEEGRVHRLRTALHPVPGVSTHHDPERPFEIAMTPDGELLMLAVDRGVRVYRWSDLLAAAGSLPTPMAAADAGVKRYASGGRHRNTYDVAWDDGERSVLFGSLDGTVRSLNVDSGDVLVLLTQLDGSSITRLVLSRNENMLATVSQDMEPRAQRKPARFEIWDYGALRLAARSAGDHQVRN